MCVYLYSSYYYICVPHATSVPHATIYAICWRVTQLLQSEPWRKAKGVTFAAAAALTGIATAAAGTQLLALVPSRRASAAPAKKQQTAEEATTATTFSSRPQAPATQDAAEATAGYSRREQSGVSRAEHASAGIGSTAVALAPAVPVSEAAVGASASVGVGIREQMRGEVLRRKGGEAGAEVEAEAEAGRSVTNPPPPPGSPVSEAGRKKAAADKLVEEAEVY